MPAMFTRLAVIFALMISAASSQMVSAGTGARALPPPGHTSRRWTHPNGCTYSRVGRPGEVAWVVIVNSMGTGKSCARKIVQIPYPGDRMRTVGSAKN